MSGISATPHNDDEDNDRDDGDEDDNDENEVWEAVINGTRPVTFRFENQTITFKVGATTYTLAVPNGEVTFSNAVTAATTTFNASATRG